MQLESTIPVAAMIVFVPVSRVNEFGTPWQA